MMRKVRLFLLIVGFGSTVNLQGARLTDASLVERVGQPQGRMQLLETRKDFSEVKRGVKVAEDFEFVNIGKGPLIIQGVHASCGCTAVEVDSGRIYEPGDKGFIKVTFDTANFRGRVSKSITVMTNERLLPARAITLKAMVTEEVTAIPPVVDFGNVVGREHSIKTVVVKSVEAGFDLKVASLRFNEKVLKASYAQTGDKWTVTIELMPDLPPGFFSETVFVENNALALPSLPILVRANIVGGVTYSPSYVEFGAIPARSSAQQTLEFKGLAEINIKDLRTELIVKGQKIQDVGRFVRVRPVNSPEPGYRKVAIELTNWGDLAGSVHGKFYFKTPDVNQKQVGVDFYAFFQE